MISPINIKIFNIPGPLFFIALYSVVMGLIATAQQSIILLPLWSGLFNTTNIAESLLSIGVLATMLGASLSFVISGIYAFRLSKKARILYAINIALQIGVIILIPFLSPIEDAQEEINTYLLSVTVSILVLIYIHHLIKENVFK